MRNSAEVLARLLKWKKAITMTVVNEQGQEDTETVFMRVVGDSVISDAHSQALVSASEYRKALRTEGTNEYKAFFYAAQETDTADMVNGVLATHQGNFNTQFEASSTPRVVEHPGEFATQEQLEVYEAEIDERDKEYEQRRLESIKKQEDRERKMLERLPKEELEKRYREATITAVCDSRFNLEVQDRIVAASVYIDPNYTERLFTSYEQFRDYDPSIRSELIREYFALRVSASTIKN